MPPLRIGVLGAAKIADRYTVPAMLATQGVEVAGVAARDPERARAFADRHGVPVLASYEAVVADPGIDAVYVPLPVGLHAEWALAALETGKHVLCEKSLAGTYEDCRRILDAARARDLVVVENFMCEMHPQNVYVRDAVARGEIGELRHASLSFGFPPFPADDQRNSAELQGGALNDAGAYCIDMASFYLGAWPTAVTATLSSAGYDVDTIGAVLLEYSPGLAAALSFGFLHDYRNEARLWGSAGQLDIDRAFSIPADRLPNVRLTRNTAADQIDLPAANHFELQLARFRDLVRNGGGKTELDARQRHALVMHAVRLSASEGRRIRLDELADWNSLEGVAAT